MGAVLVKIERGREPSDRFGGLARLLHRIVLLACGFHLHARSDWRRRRSS